MLITRVQTEAGCTVSTACSPSAPEGDMGLIHQTQLIACHQYLPALSPEKRHLQRSMESCLEMSQVEPGCAAVKEGKPWTETWQVPVPLEGG